MSKKIAKRPRITEHFPCGCRGYYEGYLGGKRLVIVVSRKCELDTPRIGQRFTHARYIEGKR